MIKKPHKFFEKYVGNDLTDLYIFLDEKYEELINGMLPEAGNRISPLIKGKYQRTDYIGAPTQMLQKYNIFDFENEGIFNLEKALKEMLLEACDYYEINYEEQDYKLHGWWNQNPAISSENYVSPLKNNKYYHDHLGGRGIPDFHGYYCVNAEPSITHYLIDGQIPFENINKNDRAIISTTGNPHGRDDWYGDKNRITIAYDMVPANYIESIRKTTPTWRSFKC
jgi:hypothetical protein